MSRYFGCGCLLTALALGCAREPVVRQYEEIGAEPEVASPAAMTQKVDAESLTWTNPEGWTEQPATGMRAASFLVGGGETPADCSIVSLPGAAGGLRANVERWIGQVELPVPPADELETFLAEQARFVTEGGHEGVLVDLGKLPGADESTAPTMLVAVIQRGPDTLFVKLVGDRAILESEQARFRSLCESVR